MSLKGQNPTNTGPGGQNAAKGREEPGISRSELETSGWNLSKQPSERKQAKKSSKKTHRNSKKKDRYSANYTIVAWGRAFVGYEIDLLNYAVAVFGELVTLAQIEE